MKKTTLLLMVVTLCTGAWGANNAAVGAGLIVNRQSPVAGRQSLDAITIPQMLSYQGMLTDTFGLPVTDTVYRVRFRFYDQPTGGTHFWEENPQVRTRGGLFSVLLGSLTPIEDVPEDGNLYLGMAVSGGAELAPRLRIASAVYTYMSERSAQADLAADADRLQGRDTTAFVRSGQANSVTGAMIVNGTIAAADLGQMGAASGQVMKWTGSAWAPRNDSVGTGGSGTVTSVGQGAGVICTPDPITTTGTVRFDSTWGHGRYVNEGQSAAGDLAGTYPSPTIAANAVGSAEVINASLRGADVAMPCTLTCGGSDGGLYIDCQNTGSGLVVEQPGLNGILVTGSGDDGIELANCQYGVFAHDAAMTGVIGEGRWGGAFVTNTEATGVGLFAYAYNANPTDTAIRAEGKGLATGGWFTGFDDGEAPGIVSEERTIVATGATRVVQGEATVKFPSLFRAHIKHGAPVRIGLTTRGDPAGILCLNASDASGFSVRLKTIPGWDGERDVEFDWVAYGMLEEPVSSAADRFAWDEMVTKRPLAMPRSLPPAPTGSTVSGTSGKNEGR